MRTFVLAFIFSLMGGGFGYWRATSEHRRVGDVVGETIDLESLLKAERDINSSREKTIETASTTGIADPNAIPKVEVIGGIELDFGMMKAGTERSHGFRFKNSGQAPLELTVLGSTCKCTIGTLEKSVLAPGEETEVKLTWKGEGYIRDFAQTATIVTNDPRQREVQLTIRGKIGRTYFTFPEELNFGEFSARESFTKTFQLYSCEETELVVTGYWAGYEHHQPFVKLQNSIRRLASNEKSEYADARYVADFTVEVVPGLPAGPVNGQVHMEVGPDSTPIAIRYTGKCLSDLRIVAGSNYDKKNTINLEKISGSEGGSKGFFIAARNPPDRKVEIKLKELIPANLKDQIEIEIGSGIAKTSETLFPITVKIPKGTPPFNRGGTSPKNYIKLTFETNLDVSNEISIFLKLVVEE